MYSATSDAAAAARARGGSCIHICSMLAEAARRRDAPSPRAPAREPLYLSAMPPSGGGTLCSALFAAPRGVAEWRDRHLSARPGQLLYSFHGFFFLDPSLQIAFLKFEEVYIFFVLYYICAYITSI